MTDFIDTSLLRLREHRLPGLDLNGSFIYPNYGGRSILNTPSSICHLLDVPGIGADSIAPEILDKLGNKYERVVLVLMDALALQTGRSPTEHGITGYEMWMKEYGVVANTITHSPIAFQNEVGSLERAGFTPDNFMTLPTLGSHLKTHGVKTYAFQHRSIAGSGLSKMLLKGTEINAFTSAADLWVNLRELLEDKIGEKLYAWVYWGVVDHFGHIYGPDNERTSAEFTNFSDALEKQFLAHLSPAARRNTLLILTADHGQIATHPNPDYDLRNHPDLSRRLHIYPTGEHRLPYLYVRPGQTEVVREYVESAWPGQFTVLETRYVVQTGLFGPGEPHPRLLDRLGDFVLISHEDAYLWWADKKDHLLGRHGGLHPEEMLVPFLAVPL
jgi:arylsulfatase A-like enzyme